MTDYYGFLWGVVIYFGVVPGLLGAGLFAIRAWQRGASPARIAVTAASGFVVAAVLCLLLVVAFLSY